LSVGLFAAVFTFKTAIEQKERYRSKTHARPWCWGCQAGLKGCPVRLCRNGQ